MIKLRSLFYIAIFLLSISSCSDTQTTESGHEILFLRNGTESYLRDSSALFLNIRYSKANGEELFSSKKYGRPLVLPYRSATWGKESPHEGPFYEIMIRCKVQDSIHFTLTAEQLYIDTFQLDSVPSVVNLANTDLIHFEIGIDQQMSENDFRIYNEEKMLMEMEKSRLQDEKQRMKEDSIIRHYLKKQNITTMTRTTNGLWYEIIEQGKGSFPIENDLITIDYDGFLLEGKLIDSSYEKQQSVTFAYGVRDVMGGWDEGFGLLKKGGKATFIMPSHLAKGPYADGPIKPYSILRYNVELLDINKRD